MGALLSVNTVVAALLGRLVLKDTETWVDVDPLGPAVITAINNNINNSNISNNHKNGNSIICNDNSNNNNNNKNNYSGSPQMRKLVCPRHLVGAVPEWSRSGLGACSAPGPLARQLRGFAGFDLRGRRSILAKSGADFGAGAALLQGQVFQRIELHGRRSTFARSSAEFVAGAALSRGQVQISWQARHFRKVKY